jgi:hypothetical protein
MEVTGQLKLKYDTQKVSEKFQKREFVLTTDISTPYPQYVIFQITQDKCAILDTFNEGEEIKVQFNLRGREWNGPQGIKFFNSLEAWKIEKVGAGNLSAPTQNNSSIQENTVTPVFNSSISDTDDLPF